MSVEHPAHAVVAIPLRQRFRGIDVREALLLRAERADGSVAWAEWSPFVEYDDATAARWLRAAREALAGDWPAPLRSAVPVNVTVPAVRPGSAEALVVESGCSTAKVKVAEPGQPEAEDLERVEAVRQALGPAGRIRVDANGAWDAGTAARRLAALDRFGLEYAEQPCATWEEMAALRRVTRVPLAVDELIRRARDPLAAARRAREVADVVVLKAQPLGGVRAALEVADAAGLPAVVSSALETSLGMAAGLALAAALPELDHACGLATVSLLDGDVTRTSLRPLDGVIEVRPVAVDEDLVARCAAPAEIAARWAARLRRTTALLDLAHASGPA